MRWRGGMYACSKNIVITRVPAARRGAPLLRPSRQHIRHNCDPETCENNRPFFWLCIVAGLLPRERTARLGLIFRRVLLRHTRVWRRRRMTVVWTFTAALSSLAFLAFLYLVTKTADEIFTSPPPPPLPPPLPPASAGRRLLRGS